VSDAPTDGERLRVRAPPDDRPVMRQVWRHLGFFHWPVPREAVAGLLPPGLEIDEFDGVAYVGIVPFTIPLSRSARLGLPVAPAFHEANLRTYVHRGGRDPGVWFFSLEAQSRLAVAGARLGYGLPYFHARMSMEVDGAPAAPTVVYRSNRTGRGPAAALSCRYGPVGLPAPAATGTLELFLVERYLLYSGGRDGRPLRSARVHHAPYPLQPAAASDVRETLTSAAGLPATAGPPALAHYVREVVVDIHRPHTVAP
jgi:uncharacterized protein YqjF (DUF2071 family)